MALIHIDESKCKKDGICTRECPAAIIRLRNGEGFPEMVPGGEEMCIECGHCVAVCPNAALSHEHVPLEASPDIKKELAVSLEQAVQFLRSRRSVRVFKDRSVERDDVNALIKIARYAPTASNAQPIEWLVITNRAEISKLAGLTVDWMRHLIQTLGEDPLVQYMPLIVAAWEAGIDVVLRNAPALVVASAPKEANNGLVDIAIALTYFELAAGPMGMGGCWAGLLQGGLLNWPDLKQALALPEDHIHHYPMMLGYPKFPYHRMPERREPKITWR